MVVTALLLTLLSVPANEPLAAANQAFAAGDWEHAARLYRAVVQAHPDQASSWARLGRSLREAGQAREALPAFERAEQLGFAPPLMQYQRALAHAHLGEKDAALALLQPLVAQAFAPPPGMPPVNADPAVAGDARFDALAKRFAALAAPCIQPGAPWRQLDFWVGSWDVYDRSGNRVGQSKNRAHPRRLRGARELEGRWRGQELEHVERGAQALGAILGGLERDADLLHRAARGWGDGLPLGPAAAGRLGLRATADLRPASGTSGTPDQPGDDGWGKDVEHGVRLHLRVAGRALRRHLSRRRREGTWSPDDRRASRRTVRRDGHLTAPLVREDRAITSSVAQIRPLPGSVPGARKPGSPAAPER